MFENKTLDIHNQLLQKGLLNVLQFQVLYGYHVELYKIIQDHSRLWILGAQRIK